MAFQEQFGGGGGGRRLTSEELEAIDVEALRKKTKDAVPKTPAAETPPTPEEDHRSILERYKDDKAKYSIFNASPETAPEAPTDGRLSPDALAAIEVRVQETRGKEATTKTTDAEAQKAASGPVTTRNAIESPAKGASKAAEVKNPSTPEKAPAARKAAEGVSSEATLRAEIAQHREALAAIERKEKSPDLKMFKQPMESIDANVAAHEQGIRDAENKIREIAEERARAQEKEGLQTKIAGHREALAAIERGEKSPNPNILRQSIGSIDAEVLAHEQEIKNAEQRFQELSGTRVPNAAVAQEATPAQTITTHEGEGRRLSPEELEAFDTGAPAERTPGAEVTPEAFTVSPEDRIFLSASQERARGLWTEAAAAGAESAVRKLGAWYNRMPIWVKVGAGVGLIAAGMTGVTGPIGGALALGMLARGALVASGTFVAMEAMLSKSKAKQERWWNKHPKAYAAVFGLVAGTLAAASLFEGSEEVTAGTAGAAPEVAPATMHPTDFEPIAVAEHTLPPESARVVVPEATIQAEDLAHINELKNIELQGDIKEIFGHKGIFGMNPSDGMEKFMYSVARMDAGEFMQGAGGATKMLPNQEFLQMTGISQYQAEAVRNLIADSSIEYKGKSVHQIMEAIAEQRVRESLATAGR